jgi:hypothetical protein
VRDYQRCCRRAEPHLWTDESQQLTERLDTLTNTALSGLLLVVIILALFLRFRLAMWVAAGIPIALLGTIAVFPYADISISTITVMAFILVLGILVDDAIVVGERVYGHEQMGKDPVQAAIDGTREVSIPVIFGVLTTMAAFLPLIIVPGRMADFFAVIGYVVIIALIFSIIESQLILPAHLAHRNHEEPGTACRSAGTACRGASPAGWRTSPAALPAAARTGGGVALRHRRHRPRRADPGRRADRQRPRRVRLLPGRGRRPRLRPARNAGGRIGGRDRRAAEQIERAARSLQRELDAESPPGSRAPWWSTCCRASAPRRARRPQPRPRRGPQPLRRGGDRAGAAGAAEPLSAKRWRSAGASSPATFPMR